MSFQYVFRRVSAVATLLALTLLASGCASVPQPDPRDPWEGYNRGMTQFNDTVDSVVFKPVATVYKEATPQLVRTGVSNFFANLGDVWSFINNVLQAKPEPALSSFWRVAVNTTIGLGGVLDPATEMRLQRYRQDFGQTLGYWGMPPGPYFVLPILGPSTLRDTAALPVDWMGHPIAQIHDVPVRNSLRAAQFVDTRAQLLGADDVLEAASPDSYAFRRDAWLQKRRNDIPDGNPPPEAERYDLDPQGQPLPVQPAPAK
jgi:phospholipid-binding lipoprotein MlaA